MGPLPPLWVRTTKTEVHNEAFGHSSSHRDWLTTSCRLGIVAARRRSNGWFEVKISPRDDELGGDASRVCAAVALAFSFIVGRQCVICGYEETNETDEVRRLYARELKGTRNTLLPPLGWELELMENFERLLGLAINFFLSEAGDRIAPFLRISQDAVDNNYQTQLLLSSICLEGLLKEAAKTMGPTLPQCKEADLSAFDAWLRSEPLGFSQAFLSRLKGLKGMFNNLSSADIFRDWITRGVLGLADEDHAAWKKTRNPSAHGKFTMNPSHAELQATVFHHGRIQNILNKIMLQLMGYTGIYIDYAAKGHPAAEFPAFSPSSNAES